MVVVRIHRDAVVLAIIGCILLLPGCLQGSPQSGEDVEPGAATTTPDATLKSAGEDCREHTECASNACDHYKADMGRCTKVPCTPGDRTDNNNLFCNGASAWEASKKGGDVCESDFQCFEPTCFMVPTCQLTDIPRTRAMCRDGRCVLEVGADGCGPEGGKRVLRKDQYSVLEDGSCMESMAQIELPTVCAPCGNGVCDEELESLCNCPEDCTGAEGAAVESYLACGCGCCGEEAQQKCLYHSKGDDLSKIIEEDKKVGLSPNCAVMGCSLGVNYTYCD